MAAEGVVQVNSITVPDSAYWTTQVTDRDSSAAVNASADLQSPLVNAPVDIGAPTSTRGSLGDVTETITNAGALTDTSLSQPTALATKLANTANTAQGTGPKVTG